MEEVMQRIVSGMVYSIDSDGQNTFGGGEEEEDAKQGGVVEEDASPPPTDVVTSFIFPSCSLHSHQDKKRHGGVGGPPPSREAVQLEASTWMAQPIIIIQSKDVGSSPLSQVVAKSMLENMLESLDRLVDARIRAYSNVLRHHYHHGSATANGSANGNGSGGGSGAAGAVEFKLRTLLEMGTDISFGCIALKVVAKTGQDDDGGRGGDATTTATLTTTTTPAAAEEMKQETSIQLKVDIDGLSIHGRPINHGLQFHAPGTIQLAQVLGQQPQQAVPSDTGFTSSTVEAAALAAAAFSAPSSHTETSSALPAFKSLLSKVNHNNNAKNGEALAATTTTTTTTVRVDTTALLASMMEEAEKLVGLVVELTNEAWRQTEQERQQCTNANKEQVGTSPVNHQGTDAKASLESLKNVVTVSNQEGQPAASLPVNKKRPSPSSVSPKLGAKTVSEVSFPALNVDDDTQDTKLTAAAFVAADAAAAAGAVGSAAASCDSSMARSNEENEHPSSVCHDNDNESIVSMDAVERASHIVDFVFGEMDDGDDYFGYHYGAGAATNAESPTALESSARKKQRRLWSPPTLPTMAETHEVDVTTAKTTTTERTTAL